MALHWFQYPRFDSPAEALEAMAPFGVTLRSPFSESAQFYWDEDANGVMVNAGWHYVFDDGRIVVRPYSCLPLRHLTGLIATTSETFKQKPSSAQGWERRQRSKTRPEPYWATLIMMRADETAIGQLVRAARHTVDAPRLVTDLTSHDVRSAPEGNPTWTRIPS